MFRLLNWLWKIFILASVFGIGYIIGREHAFEEDEDWEDDEDLKATEQTGDKKPEVAAGAAAAVDAGPGKAHTFTLSHDKAEKVSVVGTFNDWNKDTTQMTREGNTWKVTVNLKPGRHEYKFVVNNTDWISDPACKEMVADKYGSKSSVVEIA